MSLRKGISQECLPKSCHLQSPFAAMQRSAAYGLSRFLCLVAPSGTGCVRLSHEPQWKTDPHQEHLEPEQ